MDRGGRQPHVDQLTDAEFGEEWDLAGLVAAMQSLYGTDITVEELTRGGRRVEREALREEFVEDALDAYNEKEQEQCGPELMRDVERFVILRSSTQRWRSHLDSMDYLRDGVHLRAFAQKDPLVEYRAEGHVMFEELSQTIREEVVLTLFHAQVELQPQEGLQPAAQGGNGNLQYEHETPPERTRSRVRRCGRHERRRAARGDTALAPRQRDGRQRAQRHRPQRPVLVRQRQEVQEVPRRLTLLLRQRPRS